MLPVKNTLSTMLMVMHQKQQKSQQRDITQHHTDI